MELSTALTTTAPEAPEPRRRRLAWGLLLLLVVLFLLLFDWNWFKGPLERRVEAGTGREFRIEGDLDVDWVWFRPTVIANGVVLGNSAWGKAPEMFRAERVEAEVALGALFRGRYHLPQLRLVSPVLNLEREADGRANWRFRDSPDALPNTPRIDQLWVETGTLHLIEKKLRTDLDIAVRSGEAPEGGGFRPLLLTGDGRYRGNDFQLQGRVDSPLELIHEEERFRIDLEARAGTTRAHAFGPLAAPLQFRDFDLGFELSGDDMADLYPLLGLAIPRTSAYKLRGQLSRVGTLWRYRDFSGTFGDSDLAGDASVQTSGERNYLRADLVSKKLDFDDLAGFVGGTPHVGEGEQAVSSTGTGRFFPTRPYDLARLRAMDADVRLRAVKVHSPTLPLESMNARVLIEDGNLRMDPLDFGVAGGEIVSKIQLDARNNPINGRFDVRAKSLQLPMLLPKAAPDSTGRIGGRIQITGQGNSVAKLMGSADGEVGLVMGRGRISNLTLELAGLDIAEALKFLIGKDKVVPVRCGFADFDVKDGVMTTRAFAFDTTDTILLAEGSVDLGDESLDLILKPRPKDMSPLSLRSPLRVRGTLKNPTIRPQGGPLFLRGAVAAALYALAPPAALLALIETGPGKDADCSGVAPAKP